MILLHDSFVCIMLCIALFTGIVPLNSIQPSNESLKPLLPTKLSTEHAWRRPDRDGANSLYFMLRFHGQNVSYDEIVTLLGSDDRSVSINDLCKVARQHDCDAAVFECGYEDLVNMREPVIAYVESSGLQSGGFQVVLDASVPDASDSQITLLDGGMAVIIHMDSDQFLRSWSGHILKRRSKSSYPYWLYLTGGGCIAVLCILLCKKPVRLFRIWNLHSKYTRIAK